MLVRLNAKRIRSRATSPDSSCSRLPDPPPDPMFGRKLANPRWMFLEDQAEMLQNSQLIRVTRVSNTQNAPRPFSVYCGLPSLLQKKVAWLFLSRSLGLYIFLHYLTSTPSKAECCEVDGICSISNRRKLSAHLLAAWSHSHGKWQSLLVSLGWAFPRQWEPIAFLKQSWLHKPWFQRKLGMTIFLAVLETRDSSVVNFSSPQILFTYLLLPWTLLFMFIFLLLKYVGAKSLQLCPSLYDTMDCSSPGSSVHGILQARILEWVAIPLSRGSSRPRDSTCALRLLHWQMGATNSTWEAPSVQV